MTNREKQILELLKNNALVQQQEIAETLGISRSAVAGHITSLINKGYIQGRGYILAEHHYNQQISNKNSIDLCDCAYLFRVSSLVTENR